jgi:hypothetical protein
MKVVLNTWDDDDDRVEEEDRFGLEVHEETKNYVWVYLEGFKRQVRKSDLVAALHMLEV